MKSTDKKLEDYTLEKFHEIARIAGLKEHRNPEQQPTLTIHIGKLSDIKRITSKVPPKYGSSYWIHWKSRNHNDKVWLYIATDVVEEEEKLKDKILKTLLGSFGLPGKSEEFSDTCMADDKILRTELTELDRHLIEFFYSHVPPSTGRSTINKYVNEHWN